MNEIASFDVFDTVLTRAVGAPSAVFLLLGRRLNTQSLIDCPAEVFARARIAAERRARQLAGNEEITLQQVYAELGTALLLDEPQCAHLVKLECEMEAELIRAVPSAAEMLAQARRSNQRVVFLSDMYLPEAFIRAQLNSHGLWSEGDRCYVSCESGKTKGSGTLYREMLGRESVTAASVSHCGNDLDSDVRVARETGLRVEPFPEGNLNRYEQLLESHTWATNGLSSLMAGASRLARLATAAGNARESALREVAAGVTAPVLVGYVLWVLRRAEQLGIRRLYFVSRDGQILLEIATQLNAKLKLPLEFRYLYGSRQAWHLPSVTHMGEAQLSWILERTDFMSARSILARVCIEPSEVLDELASISITANDVDSHLSTDKVQELRSLLQQGRLCELILKRAAVKRETLVQYFKQEGLLEPTDWAIVDIGWRGRLQDSLAAILKPHRSTPPTGFYFGLVEGATEPEVGQREAYFFDGRRPHGLLNLGTKMIRLLETFCVADHGLVIGYAEDAGRVTPVLKTGRCEPLTQWGLVFVRKTIASFVDNLVLDENLVNPWADVRPATADLLTTFWEDPTPDEARAWGSFPFEYDQAGDHANRLAEGYKTARVIKCLFTGESPAQRDTLWRAASLRLTPYPLRLALKYARRARRLVQR